MLLPILMQFFRDALASRVCPVLALSVMLPNMYTRCGTSLHVMTCVVFLCAHAHRSLTKQLHIRQERTKYTLFECVQGLKEKKLVQTNLDKVDGLKPIAQELGCTLAQLALAWCVKNEHVSTVITGATKPEQASAVLTATSHSA